MSVWSRGMVLILASLPLTLTSRAAELPNSTTPREQYEALTREFEAATTAWGLRGGGNRPEDPSWIESYAEAPMWTFAPRLLEFAEKNAGTPEVVDALLRVVGLLRTGRISDRSLFPTYTRCLEILI